MSMETVNDRTVAPEERSAAPALTKGFAILDLIAQEPGIGFAAIRSRLGLPNSSCHHLISTLCKVGALQLQADRGYVLGLRLFELGTIAASQRKIEQSALPALKRLAQEVELTCHLGVMEGTEAVYLMKVEGLREIRVNTWIGKRLSLHSSSLGKVLLAWLSPGEIEDKLRNATWEAKTPSTITDPAKFRALLKAVRARGWAFDDEEDAPSIRCVAAPVFDMKGRIIAAISAVGTVLDIEPERFPVLAEKLCATAAEISANLGYGQVERL
ncbi:IclR family transcriptional regulator [Rhodopseudomonas palustris]|uniref:Transcriptional regulator, IclR family n=1 Tax=Rhodopseudomonas palustris (strain BisB18) TaxID=316056 RepID=Q20Y80_RHOPB